MADTDTSAQPMRNGDIDPPPATTEFQPAVPLKDQGVEFAPEGAASGTGTGSEAGNAVAGAGQALKSSAGKLGGQATDRLRAFADDGKARAGGALDQLVQMLNDAAGQVDDKLGAQYGDYARNAANSIAGFSDQVKNKDVDELVDDARGLVRASPGVAIGVAAALGFAVARVVQSGIEAGRQGGGDDRSA